MSILATAMLCIVITGSFSASYFSKRYIANLEARLDAYNKLIEKNLENTAPEAYPAEVAKTGKLLGGNAGVRLTLIRIDGKVLADTEGDAARMENHSRRPEIISAIAHGFGFSRRTSHTVGKEFLYAARVARGVGGERYIIRSAAPAEYIEAETMRIVWSVAVVALMMLALAAVVALAVSEHFSRPLRRIRDTSARIAAGELSARSGISGGDDFGQLGSALDAMAVNIQSGVEELQRKRTEIEDILASMRDGLIVVDKEKKVLLSNSAVCKILGVDDRDYAGEPLVHLVRHTRVNDEATAALAGGPGGEFTVETNPVTRETMEVRIHPFSGRDGRPGGAIVTLRDVTRIKRLEQVRTEFIENASHELRTPVTILRGLVETLVGGAADNEADLKRFLTRLDKETKRLLNLTEDIISLEAAEKQTAAEEHIDDAATVLAVCVEPSANAAREKGLMIIYDYPASPVRMAMGSADFRIVCTNLIDNAIKFTDAGSITIKLETNEKASVLTVADTGEGIPPQHLDRIFERFYRVDKSRSREKGGTGLGLSIVRHTVEKHGGRVSVESKPGAGSAFMVEIPA